MREAADPIDRLRAAQRQLDAEHQATMEEQLTEALEEVERLRCRASQAEQAKANAEVIARRLRRQLADLERNMDAVLRGEKVDDRSFNEMRRLVSSGPGRR